MIKSLLTLLLFTVCFQLTAADTTRIKNLYDVLLTRTRGVEPSNYRWPHRDILYQALGIDPATMPDSEIAQRMQLGWQQLSAVRISSENKPPKYFYELLREALHYGHGAILLDAVRWNVDLNYMDFNTHHTLIDDLEEEYRNSYDEHRPEWLREYKQVLLAGGAKYFVELNYYMRQLARKYDRVRPPAYGLYPVQKNGKWGWVDAQKKIIVPLRYKSIRYFTPNLFEVSDDGKTFYQITRTGKSKRLSPITD